MEFDISKLEKIIEYTFKDKKLGYMALSHSSYANEKKKRKISSYERLEFLGDAVVDMIVSEYLYNNYPQLPEGDLTKIRAMVVCEATLCKCSQNLNLGQFLFLGKGEEITGGRQRVSILADIFEAITAAIYLDGGYETTQNFVINNLKHIIDDAMNGMIFLDYKTQLQEILQQNGESNISYEVVKESGPDHAKEFEVQVINGSKILGVGNGRTKKDAEQTAAKEAIDKIDQI